MVESASLTTGVLATAVLVLLTCCIYLRSRQRSAHARQLDFEAARNNKLSDLEAGAATPRAGDSSGSSPLDSARAKPPPLPPKTPTTPRRGDLRAAVDSRKALAAESRELRRDIATTPRGTAAAAPAAEEPAGARTDIPEELRQRIDAMRRELRSDKAASRSRRNSKEDLDNARSRRPSSEAVSSKASSAANSRRPSREELIKMASAAAAATPAAPAATTPRAACDSTDTAEAVVTTPRKQRIDPPTAEEEQELAMFSRNESVRKQRESEKRSPTLDAAAAGAKLREMRGDADGRSERSKAAKQKAKPPKGGTNSDEKPKRSKSAEARPKKSSSSNKAVPPPMPASNSVQSLKEREQLQAADQKQREKVRKQTERLLERWQPSHKGDIYMMLNTVHLFPDLVSKGENNGGSSNVARGDSAGLKKAWHKLAAKLHPDRQRSNPLPTQVLAEEVFKLMSLAYHKEAERLAGTVRC